MTLIGRAEARGRAQLELSPATARLSGSPSGSRSTADRTLVPFREFPALSHSAAALTIESRASLSIVQGCIGWADRSALSASFCQAVPPLLCDCSQSTDQRELLSPVDSDCCVCSLPCTRAVRLSPPRDRCTALARPLAEQPPSAVPAQPPHAATPRRCRSVPSCRSATRCQRSADEQSSCRSRSQASFHRFHALSLL